MKTINYLYREIDNRILLWSKEERHKPLLINGPEQSGKTSAIRNLGKEFKYFLEVDLSQDQEVCNLFMQEDISPQTICEHISIAYNIPIIPNQTLLFLDNVDSCPKAALYMYRFYGEYPDIHIVLASSELEASLYNLCTFGLGYLSILYISPLSSIELLLANNESHLFDAIEASNNNPLIKSLYSRALEKLEDFILLDGMPITFSSYIDKNSMVKCLKLIDKLIHSYKDDFSKCNHKILESPISTPTGARILNKAKDFVYSSKSNIDIQQIKDALELLAKGGLEIPLIRSLDVNSTSKGDSDKEVKYNKELLKKILKLNISKIIISNKLEIKDNTTITEIEIGFEIQKSEHCYKSYSIYFWSRAERGSDSVCNSYKFKHLKREYQKCEKI